MSVLGLGHDVVDVSAFAEQLAEPGSRMRGLFSVREVRQAGERARRKNDDESTHLAAKWAGKEAVLKAWCDALGDMPNPYTIENFPWNGIEIVDDSRGRPCVALRPDVERKLCASLPPAASRNSDEMSGAPRVGQDGACGHADADRDSGEHGFRAGCGVERIGFLGFSVACLAEP